VIEEERRLLALVLRLLGRLGETLSVGGHRTKLEMVILVSHETLHPGRVDASFHAERGKSRILVYTFLRRAIG
jgi:hypothetical protein